METQNFYIGYTTRTRDVASAYLKSAEDRVPSNYKDPQKIADYAAKVAAEQLVEAANYPITAYVASVHVITDDKNNVVFRQFAAGDGSGAAVARAFLAWVLSVAPRQFSAAICDSSRIQSRFFGYQLQQLFKIAAFEVLGYNCNQPAASRIVVPVGFWSSQPGVYGVENLLLRSPEKKDIEFGSLLQYFGVADRKDPVTTASAVRRLALRAQLVPGMANFDGI